MTTVTPSEHYNAHEAVLFMAFELIDVCLADTGFSMTEIQCAAYLGEGIIPERSGNGRGLQNTYETSDGWVLIAASSDNIWPRVCTAIEAPEWVEDPRFTSVRGVAARRGKSLQSA